MANDRNRVANFVAAIQPLVRIADAYDASELDEARPGWNVPGRLSFDPERVELFQGRGGRTLLTLADCFAARDALRELQQIAPLQPSAAEPAQETFSRKRALKVI